MPGLNSCSSPLAERSPSGNQTRFFLLFQRIARFALATLSHFAQEIAHRLDARDPFVGQFHPATFSDLEGKIQPLERVDTKVELWTCVRRQPLAAVSLRQQFPD